MAESTAERSFKSLASYRKKYQFIRESVVFFIDSRIKALRFDESPTKAS